MQRSGVKFGLDAICLGQQATSAIFSPLLTYYLLNSRKLASASIHYLGCNFVTFSPHMCDDHLQSPTLVLQWLELVQKFFPIHILVRHPDRVSNLTVILLKTTRPRPLVDENPSHHKGCMRRSQNWQFPSGAVSASKSICLSVCKSLHGACVSDLPTLQKKR